MIRFLKPTLLLLVYCSVISCSTKTGDPGLTAVPHPAHGSNLTGLSTSSFSDFNLSTTALAPLKPHFMRYYLGSTVVFDENNVPNGIASVTNFMYPRNGELAGSMAPNMNGWKYTPALDFDKFIQLCRTAGAEPVVLLPVYAAYSTTPGPKMTKDQLYNAHIAFVKYANITRGYNVKYWEIGNEDDIDPDNTSAAVYATVFNELVPLLKKIDPTIECGANTFWNTDRWKALLPLIKSTMGFAVIHQYSPMQTYNDFLTRDLLDWKGDGSDDEIMVDRFLDARKKLNDTTITSRVLVTEISSLCTYAPANPRNNCVWKGLHNIQLLLQYGTYPQVMGTMNWVSWYGGGLENTFNVFSGSDETTLSPVGLAIQLVNDHIYSVVEQKIKRNGNTVEITVSHSDGYQAMSVFVINKSKVSQTVVIDIPDFKGDPAANTKWVYVSSAADEWSQDLSYKKMPDTDLTTPTGSTITVPPLSCTVYEF